MKLVYIFLITFLLAGCAMQPQKRFNPSTRKCEVVTNTSRFTKDALPPIIGGGLGAAVGAIAGKSPGKGAAIGALVGLAGSMFSEIFDSQTGVGSPECQDQPGAGVAQFQQQPAVNTCATVRDTAIATAVATGTTAKKIRTAKSRADAEYVTCSAHAVVVVPQTPVLVVPDNNKLSVCTGRSYINRAQAVQAENTCRAQKAQGNHSFEGVSY